MTEKDFISSADVYYTAAGLAEKAARDSLNGVMPPVEISPDAQRELAKGFIMGRITARLDALQDNDSYFILPHEQHGTAEHWTAFRCGYLQALDDLEKLLPGGTLPHDEQKQDKE